MSHRSPCCAFWTLVLAILLLGALGPAPAGRRDSAQPTAVAGDLTVLQEDDFATGGTRLIHLLREHSTGRLFELRFDRRAETRLRSGTSVVVRGVVSEGRIWLDEHGVEVVQTAAAAVTGVRSAVVLVVDFQDTSVTCTNASIADLVFTGEQSVAGLYVESSFGQFAFSGDANLDGEPDVFRVSIEASSSGSCDPFAWGSSADQAAQDAGIDLSQYQHKIYVLPGNTNCGWAGLATLGCFGACQSWVATCNLPDVYAHELGHNLGMAHSSTDENNNGVVDCEYCDRSDFMGIGGAGWRQVNAPHKEQMGWLPVEQVVTVGDPGSQTLVLSPLENDPGTASYPQVLKVFRPGDADPYYLSYRRRTGYDYGLGLEYAGRTNIHRHPGGGANNTLWIAALDDGEEYADEATELTITQIAHDDGSATILIGGGCAVSAPVASVSPASQTGTPGQALSYTVEVYNGDASSCGPTSFDVTAGVPQGWASDSASLSLDPGEQASTTIAVTSPTGAVSGDYALEFLVTDAVRPDHDDSGLAVYVVQGDPPQPPTDLVGSVVRNRFVHLSWSPGEGPQPAAYRVYRNGTFLAETDRARYMDWSPAGQPLEYHVTAVDGSSGLESDPSVTVEVAFGGGPDDKAYGARRSDGRIDRSGH